MRAAHPAWMELGTLSAATGRISARCVATAAWVQAVCNLRNPTLSTSTHAALQHLVATVDGCEGDGADVKGVARVVVELHRVGGALLARRQHLPRLRRHLRCGEQGTERRDTLHITAQRAQSPIRLAAIAASSPITLGRSMHAAESAQHPAQPCPPATAATPKAPPSRRAAAPAGVGRRWRRCCSSLS